MNMGVFATNFSGPCWPNSRTKGFLTTLPDANSFSRLHPSFHGWSALNALQVLKKVAGYLFVCRLISCLGLWKKTKKILD